MTKPAAYSITGAPKSLKDDVRSREVRYLLSMGIRTACFLLAIFAADGLLRWALIVAAVVLPYIAVVLANAGRERPGRAPEPFIPGRLEITGSSDRPEVRVPASPDEKSREEVRRPH